MAEARHRPRPGNAHPDALEDDPDGVHGGDRPDDVHFECEDALPGGSDDEDTPGTKMRLDPAMKYKPKKRLLDEEVFDALHRYPQLQKQSRDPGAYKHKVLKSFARDHGRLYELVRSAALLTPSGGNNAFTEEALSARAAALDSQQ